MKKTPGSNAVGGFGIKSLTMTYSHMGEPHYHRRWSVSRLSSGWDQVVPDRYGRQAKRMITGKDEIKRDGDFLERGVCLALALSAIVLGVI